ncbi:MAG: peptidyl-prolyl cis-trans isomerase [Prevotellaceae bacterium]|jgi:hypothetical protein|nr:peptidyl-prolyl cis-trans isomerase [Prevotellaceae bacterium]
MSQKNIIKPVYALSVALLLIFASCADNNSRNEIPIAEIGAKKLYMSDIDYIMQDLSGDDSLAVLTDYVNRWARNSLVLKQAENNLSPAAKDVSDELENYRASLLIYRYEQAYIAQRMDTVVSDQEIENFYKENADNFQLTGLLIKGLYLKVRINFHDLDKIRRLYRSDKEKDRAELEKICVQSAEKFDTFNNEWVDFALLAKDLPANYENYENKIIQLKHLEERDENYIYLLKVSDVSMKGSIAPLAHVKNNVRTIILNRRKVNMIRQLENDIYNEAFKQNEVKINIK